MRKKIPVSFVLFFLCTSPLQAQTVGYQEVAPQASVAGVSNGELGACDYACAPSSRGWFASVDYLAIRPHFSEAVAFASGQQTLNTIDTQGHRIAFDYESSFRTTIGMGFGQNESLQMTYSYFYGNENIAGVAGGPGQFIVDPFGNLVGTAVVVDPTDFRFGNPVTGGDQIQTFSSVNANVVDIGWTRQLTDGCFALQLEAGAKFGEVDQSYRSVITLGGVPISDGQFSARFIGAGPRVGMRASRDIGCQRRLSLNASMHGSLLVGNHDTRFSNTVALPFTGSQRNVQSRTNPVLEAEVSADWCVNNALTLRSGWLFHSWFDMGVSGGTFGGFFAGADDSNIMAFDGLFLGAELRR